MSIHFEAMPKKSIYTLELQEVICNAIASEGIDKAGYSAGNIGEKTFYTWINKYEQFRQAVANARAKFSQTCPQKMKLLAKQRMLELLENNGQTTVWRRRRELQQTGDVNFRLVETMENSEERPIPSWVFNKILPNPVPDLDTAIAMVIAAGYLVIDPTIPREQEQVASGLTDEMASAIKQKLLGINDTDAEHEELEGVYQ